MLVEALRRFALLLAGVGATTVVLSLGLGAAAGYSLTRSIAIGLYIVGSLLLLFGFFVGNRGPFRPRGESFGFFAPRSVRGSTVEERHEAINSSAVFVTLGLVLIVLGVASDPAHKLF
jgi:hypothetical protein